MDLRLGATNSSPTNSIFSAKINWMESGVCPAPPFPCNVLFFCDVLFPFPQWQSGSFMPGLLQGPQDRPSLEAKEQPLALRKDNGPEEPRVHQRGSEKPHSYRWPHGLVLDPMWRLELGLRKGPVSCQVAGLSESKFPPRRLEANKVNL